MPCGHVARAFPLLFGSAVLVLAAPGVVSALATPKQLDIIKEAQNPLTRALVSITLENEFAPGLGPENELGYSLWVKPRVR